MNRAFITRYSMALAVVGAGMLTPFSNIFAAALSLSDTPLVVSSSVQPNVMLLIDTSGSMDNIIWADGYDDATDYPDWSNSGNYWSASDGNVFLSDVSTGSCSSGKKQGKRGGTTKCLKLPDPRGGGNTRYSGNYLNYLFYTYANNTDLTTGTIPNDYRMNVAKSVATNLVTTTPGMYFGTSSFYGPSSKNYAYGATIDAVCGSSPGTIPGSSSASGTITKAISGYSASTNTPLAEALYEVSRYFRGLPSYYHGSGTTYTSPIQYRCQKNFTIAVTDGLPTYDNIYPTNDPDDPSPQKLPNWDALAPATTQAMYPVFPQYSDGFQPSGAVSSEGYTLYLDDIAKFAYDTDMKKSGNDTAGVSYNDPAFPTQNMETYTVGFSTENQMLQDAASYGHGRSFTATNAAQLTSALQSAIADIVNKTSSTASVALNTGSIGSGARVYQGRFNSSGWAGQLLSFPINTDSTSPTFGALLLNGSGPDGSEWDAGSLIPAATSRTIITRNTAGTAGIAFQWANLSTGTGGQQAALGSVNVFNYIRGDNSQEQRNGGSYRNRSTLLGDIVDSAPVYVSSPPFRYQDNWGTGAPETAYSTFRSNKSSRAPMLYVGANDGMLHGFNATTGVETMAYIPSSVFQNLSLLTSPTYTHKFYVDGTPTVGDAFFNSAWHTTLIGSLDKGGQGIFALDITDPSTFSETGTAPASLLLWEFTDANDADLGYTYSHPAIVRMANGKWAAVFGNGYNNTQADGHASATGHAVLYIAFINDGRDGTWSTGDFIKIDTMVGTTTTPNGLATVDPVDLNGDNIVDAIYAGDLQGNMWKFNVSDTDSTQWKSAFGSVASPAPLFTACTADPCTTTNRQPITTKPTVNTAPNNIGGVLVYFGTGKYLETTDSDITTSSTQSFYAIWDNNAAAVSGRNALQPQTIDWEGTANIAQNGTSDTITYPLRVTSNNTVNWTTKKGWYMDLLQPGGVYQGERQVTDARLRNGHVVFTTLIPTGDPCSPGGTSWLMELDAATGSRLTYSPFDLSGDGHFTAADYVTISIAGTATAVPVSGRKLNVGGAATPSVIAGQDQEYKYSSGTAVGGVGIDVTREHPGVRVTGRQSWIQLK